MDIDITALDSNSLGATFGSAHDLHRRLTLEMDPAIDADTEAGFRSSLRGNSTFNQVARIASIEGEAVGILRMWVNHRSDNADKAEATIEVDPGHRRYGVGRALLGAALDICDNQRRVSLVCLGANSPETHGFWTSFGAELRLVERESRLWLSDTDAELMNSWVANRTQRAGGYELRHWRGPTPEDMLSTMATLGTAMNDAPRDDLDWDDDVWTEHDVAELDSWRIDAGFDRWVCIAAAADGSPAGYTSVSTNLNRPRFAYQGDTVVLPEHRDRGIGRWLKGDMWCRLRSEAPVVEAIDTYNAQSNDPMLSINIAMGFKPLIVHGAWQADVTTLRHALENPHPSP